MSSVVLLPLAPPPPPPGEVPSLEGVERETARRLGPFAWLEATGGTASTVVVATARSNAPVGGWEGLWLLRREAVRPNDRVRTVDRVDGPSGSLVLDFPYEDAPVAGERVELHHLHPDQQLRVDVLAGLRRCYVTDVAEVPPPAPPEPPEMRAVVTEVGGGWSGNGNGTPWLLLPRTGNGNGASLYAQPAATASGGGAVVDLTAVAFWLTAPRQVLAVGANGVALPPAGRWGRAGGWGVYANRGRLYLTVPTGTSGYGAGLQVRAYRDAFGLVNGLDDPRGPLADGDELAVPVEYAAALAHAEAWRRHADRLEASAAEGRFATQEMASVEATRCAAKFADWLFRPQTERGDVVGSPWGGSGGGTVNGLGGSGALAGAVVNQNDPYA
jgi:hypothetical protein